MQGSSRRGFTLIELLVVLALIAVLTPIAVSGLTFLARDARLSSILNDFHAALELTRSHALRSGYSTVICKTSDGYSCTESGNWSQGWLIFEDRNLDGSCQDKDADGYCDDDGGRLIRRGHSISHLELTLSASGNLARHRVRFDAHGLAQGYASTFSLCDLQRRQAPRGLVLSMTGRIRPAAAGDNIVCPASP